MDAQLVVGLSTTEAQVIAAVALVFASTLAALAGLGALVEARRARKQAVRPVLALDLVEVGRLYVEIGIANVGQGAAVDVDVELAFIPDDQGTPEVRDPWTWPLLQPGRTYQFGPPDVGGKKRPDLDVWVSVYPRVTLTGTVQDQLGDPHDVSVELADLPGLRARAMQARLASQQRKPVE